MLDDEYEKNRTTVESLLESFTPVTCRLTPEVEPAAIYSLQEPIGVPDSSPENPE